MTGAVVALVAVPVAAALLDAVLGEPRRAHPLVGFGRLARALERRLHADARWSGAVAWSLAVLPAVALAWLAQRQLQALSPTLSAAFATGVLYLALGHRSLGEHARPVAAALSAGNIDGARAAVGRMVSRDTGSLDPSRVAAAATESVLENGCDAVFGALFWFALLGAPGVVLYRLANTLDAMWGYRTTRYRRFGWAAARIDDVLNWLPARLTALTYAVLGNTAGALRCWRLQAPQWDSPNAGPVMAAGAGALGTLLGGAASYHGVRQPRPVLGEGAPADPSSILRALALVRNGVALWLAVALLAAIAVQGWRHA